MTEKCADREGSMFQKQISNLTILLTNAPSATLKPDMAGLQGPLLCPIVSPALKQSSSQKGAESESSVKKTLLEMMCYKDTSYQGAC